MARRISPGENVQTPFGKGVVREVRNNGRLLVDVQGRAMVLSEGQVSPLAPDRPGRGRPRPSSSDRPAESFTPRQSCSSVREVDLHGLTVEGALARIESAINDALLADVEELRLIHGKSGGRLKAAVHQRLREIGSVRGFRLDPRNAGVTIVKL